MKGYTVDATNPVWPYYNPRYKVPRVMQEFEDPLYFGLKGVTIQVLWSRSISSSIYIRMKRLAMNSDNPVLQAH